MERKGCNRETTTRQRRGKIKVLAIRVGVCVSLLDCYELVLFD